MRANFQPFNRLTLASIGRKNERGRKTEILPNIYTRLEKEVKKLYYLHKLFR